MSQNDRNTTYTEKETSSKEFILGAVIGGAIGAATALFLAPKSGTELRQDLNTQAGLLKERSYEWKDQAVTKGNELATTAKEKSAELSTLAKEKSAELSQTVQTQSNAVVEKVKSFKGNAEDTAGNSDPAVNEAAAGSAPSVTPVDPSAPETDESPLVKPEDK